jgi:hypothetical protein
MTETLGMICRFVVLLLGIKRTLILDNGGGFAGELCGWIGTGGGDYLHGHLDGHVLRRGRLILLTIYIKSLILRTCSIPGIYGKNKKR